MHIKKMLALLLMTACLQLAGYAGTNHDHRYPAPPINYHLVTIFESTYYDDYLYIEYKSFEVHYSAPLPYNVDISFNVIYEDSNGNFSNDEHYAYGTQGSTSTRLHTWVETYYQDSNSGYLSTTDLMLNWVQ